MPIESLCRFDQGQVADVGIGQEFGALNVCAQVLALRTALWRWLVPCLNLQSHVNEVVSEEIVG